MLENLNDAFHSVICIDLHLKEKHGQVEHLTLIRRSARDSSPRNADNAAYVIYASRAQRPTARE